MCVVMESVSAADINIMVINPRTHDSDRGKYTSYMIDLQTSNLTFSLQQSQVRRRYSEFVWLQARLAEHFHEIVANQAIYLSDSTLHLFLQTPLSVQEIDKCVKGKSGQGSLETILEHGQVTLPDLYLDHENSQDNVTCWPQDMSHEPHLARDVPNSVGHSSDYTVFSPSPKHSVPNMEDENGSIKSDLDTSGSATMDSGFFPAAAAVSNSPKMKDEDGIQQRTIDGSLTSSEDYVADSSAGT